MSWVPVGWAPNRWRKSFGPLLAPDLAGAVHREIANVTIPADTVVVALPPLWNEDLAAETPGMFRVALATWETDRLPADYVEALEHYDRVIVPFRFNREVFVASGLSRPIGVVPHLAEVPPAEAVSPGPAAGTARFTFYVVASWTTRKAVLDTVSAFVDAFDGHDDVEPVIQTTPEDLVARGRMARGQEPWSRAGQQSWFSLAKALAGCAGVPKIELGTRRLSREEIEALHARGDCFVSLSRGEGWGLGPFDAGRRGKPVVVTGWGRTEPPRVS